jgi:hypothetical protein
LKIPGPDTVCRAIEEEEEEEEEEDIFTAANKCFVNQASRFV